MPQNVQDHQDNCCVIHGCSYNEADCPIFTGGVRQNKKKPCEVCKEMYGDSQIVYEVEHTQYADQSLYREKDGFTFFDKLSKLRLYLTSMWIDNAYNKEGPVPGQEFVIEYKLVPIRKVPLERYIEEYKIFKRFK